MGDMWASDFPHTDSTWPNSRKVIEKDFCGRSGRRDLGDRFRECDKALSYSGLSEARAGKNLS